ncbi:MAG: efflux RND transporter periplasmic adaptor subunit [Planctomycetaceae bacterium]|nr:efflux RND transporter periplasmic adaptor subunit [Planctomycetaceae bacterium]
MNQPVLLLMFSSLVLVATSGCESEALSHEESAAEAHASSHGDGGGHPVHKVIVTSPVVRDVVSTQPYVCQIRSCKHIEVRSLDGGYLEEIGVNEGQAVRKGDLMFQILATLYQAKLDTEIAEAQRIEIELKNAQSLQNQGIVSPQEIAIRKAELAKAQAKVSLANAELEFASIRAPFDGIVDRQIHQLGSLIEEGEVLTTLSDNSVMWVYFNVPEARYLEYKAELDQSDGRTDHLQIELKLANGQIFPEPGKIGAIEADFNNTTGNIAFRADFPNSTGILRNGQTGTILIHRTLHGALVIPQRATFEILDKRYAYVVNEAGIVHQRDIEIATEQDDIFVLKNGLAEGEKIVFEGVRQVRDGEHIEYEFRDAAEILSNQKFHAE